MSRKTVLDALLKNRNKNKTKNLISRVRKVMAWIDEGLRIKKIKAIPSKTGFQLKKILYGDIEVFEFWEMKFVNQDNTKEEEQSLEARVKAIEWQFDTKNILAAAVVMILVCLLIYSNIYVWYHNELWTIAARDPKFDSLINFSLYTNFIEPNFLLFPQLARINNWLVETLTIVCSEGEMLF